MALPPQFLDELRLRTPLPALIGRKTRLVRSGRNWKACCPFHGEKTPSFYVYDDHFHCFGCGAHGDAIAFVMRAEGASFPEAVERLASEAGLDVPKPTPEAAAREKRARDLHGVLEAAAAAFARRLRLPEGAEGLAYLRRRGLSDETIAKFGLGWSGGGRGAIAADLKAEGITPEQLAEAGLMREREEGGFSDLFFNRVMFPIRDRRGRMISFGGRILGDGQPKYVNGPETALFRKRQSLYGLDLAREGAFRGGMLVAVEGYMDVIALHQAGFGAAVAPLGTALTQEQMEELWRLSPEPVLCFDGDAAGARAAARAAEAALPLLTTERSLRLATLPPGEDPDTLIVKGGPAAFQAVLDAARPLGEALYGLVAEGRPMATPEQRAALRHRLEEAAGAIKDRALAGEYRRVLLDRFFQATRGAPRPPAAGGRGGPPGRFAPRPALLVPRPAITPERTRTAQAQALLAITLRHPWLLQEVEESLAGLDLPAGPFPQCRASLLAWLAEGHVLDSAGVMDHLAKVGLGEFAATLLRDRTLPAAALPGAQPQEALDAWWHFYGLLRGEAELRADLAEAEAAWAGISDPAELERVARRQVRLRSALNALRRGEWDEAEEGSSGEGAWAEGGPPPDNGGSP